MVMWGAALSKTRNLIKNVFSPGAGNIEELDIDEVEETLLRSDVPAQLVMKIVDELESASRRVSRKDLLRNILLKELGEEKTFNWTKTTKPFVLLLLGVNGSGKTTTAAKLAKLAKNNGGQPMLCGSDTFRAAGSSQLKLWSEKIGCPFVGGEMGADAAGVAFNAIDTAVEKNCDIVLVDSAGRMHTKTPLMDELPKMCRSMNKRIPGSPHEVWMVLDASIGQNAVIQAQEFNKVVPLTGLVVTKLDGSSKAGFLFSVRAQLEIPIFFAGLGEGEDDLVPFSPTDFVDALFDSEKEES
jgi:fused signal recognition particle receptor